MYLQWCMFICPEITKKHNMAIAYSEKNSETTMVLNTAIKIRMNDKKNNRPKPDEKWKIRK